MKTQYHPDAWRIWTSLWKQAFTRPELYNFDWFIVLSVLTVYRMCIELK